MRQSSQHGAAVPIVIVCAIACMAVLPAQAQFDPRSLQKKAEKALQTEVEKGLKGTKPVLIDGMEPEQVLVKAAAAVHPLLEYQVTSRGALSGRTEAKAFCDRCRAAEYPKQRSRVERAVAAKPVVRETHATEHADVMEHLPSRFEALTRDELVPEITRAIELARSERSAGPGHEGAANEAAQSAKLVCDGILLVTPNDAEVKRLRADAESAARPAPAAHPAPAARDAHAGAAGTTISASATIGTSSPATSAFGAAHAARIVFAARPITVGREDPATLRGYFTPADNIQGMAYLRGAFRDAANGGGVGTVTMSVDGSEKARAEYRIPTEQLARTWMALEIIPDPTAATPHMAVVFTKAISELAPAVHALRFQLLTESGVVIAAGDIEVDCTRGLDRVAAIHQRLLELGR